MIPYGRQEITAEDIDAVTAVLRSELITQGPVVPRFEQAVADYCGASRAVAVSSGTAALHLACRALELGTADVVWTSPITFVASANCARYCGAEVDFVDIDPETANLSPQKLAEKLDRTWREGGQLPKVVIAVHLAGQSCDMAALGSLAEQYGFYVIEDAAHAIGGCYQGEPVGCGRYSDITIFSFHPVKIITTGEGGMAITNNEVLADRMACLRAHGITRHPELMTQEPDGPWYYEQIGLGYNYRMTDIQAALGVSQLQRTDEYVARRHEMARRYDESLQDLPVARLSLNEEVYSAYHLYVIRVPNGRHRGLFEYLRKEGIGVNLHYIPLYRQPDFGMTGCDRKNFPEAERYYSEAITLPLFPTMDWDSQKAVCKALSEGLAA